MNLTYLKYVVEVEKSGSITGAAQNLYMGQPNLSKAIKELENDIGITLFKRTAKGVVPTRQGRCVRAVVPWREGEPFPIPELFCFASVGQGRVTYLFDGEGRPIMPK